MLDLRAVSDYHWCMRRMLDGVPVAWIASRGLPALLAVGCAPLLLACGAKTGLNTPDVVDVTMPMEAGVDAAQDAPLPLPDVPTPPSITICVPPDADGFSPITASLNLSPRIQVADVLFVVDRTGSMMDAIGNIRDGLESVIIPGLLAAIPDVHIGLVTHADFPIYPYGDPGDAVFALEQPLGSNYTAVQGAIANIIAQGGGDNPEAQVETLYQVATGEGFPPFISASGGCPSVGTGYACFRPNAEAVILQFSDAPFHNGPMNMGAASYPYDPLLFAPYPAPHAYETMLATLVSALHPRYIGINNGGDAPDTAQADMLQLAHDTGTVDSSGNPIGFTIGEDGVGLSQDVVTAVQTLTSETPFDVSAEAQDLNVAGASLLVLDIRPISATPMGNIARMDDTTFYSAVPGTQLMFAIDVDPTRTVPGPREQDFPVRIQFLADGRPSLGYSDILIVVPAIGGHCGP